MKRTLLKEKDLLFILIRHFFDTWILFKLHKIQVLTVITLTRMNFRFKLHNADSKSSSSSLTWDEIIPLLYLKASVCKRLSSEDHFIRHE
jgi:hypothetical protein